jgi:hypothetical protein
MLILGSTVIIFSLLLIVEFLKRLRTGLGIEIPPKDKAEIRKKAKPPVPISGSSIIILRDNGVTVYDSKERAESSMEWADVVRNPNRRAFDATGMEFAFKLRAADDHSSPVNSFWKRSESQAVELESASVIPHPEHFREALIHWLDGKGVQVEHDIDLADLILLASRTRTGRPTVTSKDADRRGIPHGDAQASAR